MSSLWFDEATGYGQLVLYKDAMAQRLHSILDLKTKPNRLFPENVAEGHYVAESHYVHVAWYACLCCVFCCFFVFSQPFSAHAKRPIRS